MIKVRFEGEEYNLNFSETVFDTYKSKQPNVSVTIYAGETVKLVPIKDLAIVGGV